jgi:ATP-dependent Lon protease
MRERINSQIKEEMGKNQREYVLRQQLKAIKEELGEEDGDQGDLDLLDEDHSGLEKVKKRIVEYLAVRKLKPDKKGPILCLIGPPGVGKTSLGRSIARALGRKFVRISLGGVHDEAAIRGHRRTYVGALPGQIIQGMKKAATINPVFMLDEIDKIGHDFRGDPAAALLEVLDPEQNDTFSDHYLEIPYDLSKSMFIATCNVSDTIPAPLRDRMEIIEIPGYTRREKAAIARDHLVPKQLDEHGLNDATLSIGVDAVDAIIDSYTREAGVRSLERQLAAVIRSIAVKVAEGDRGPFSIQQIDDLRTALGPPRFTSDIAERMDEPGIATGLAWTSVGGEILFVEATRMYGKGKLQLTGQLGEVMKESAQAAMSYVRTHAKQLHVPEDFLDNGDIHIHIPTGGVPKDGPSAGVTMMTALVSLLTGIRVRHDTAMTGEITLRGKVLPVGGVKEKVLAAHRAGIKRVILPERCTADLDEVPQEVRDELEFIAVHKMDDVLLAALEDPGKLDLKPHEDEGASAKRKGRARDRVAGTPSSAP